MPTPEEIVRDVFGKYPPIDICVNVTFPRGTIGNNPEATTGRLRSGHAPGLYFLLAGRLQQTLAEGYDGWSDEYEMEGDRPVFTNMEGEPAPWYKPRV
jgi:hypothetical protein